MSKPLIVVLSRDEMMASELPGLFRGRAEIRVCRCLDEFMELARTQEPCALLADFRRSSNNGGDEARTIEAVQLQHPRVRLAMVTPVDCPESLERCASKIELTHFRGHLDRAALLKAFGPIVDAPFPFAGTEPHLHESNAWLSEGGRPDAAPLGHLTGTSRRCETWSADLSKTLAELEIAAMQDVAILLIGETGTGKSDLARIIHEISLRRHEPFLTVPCGSLPDELFERELFGQSPGSTLASPQEGVLQTARRGTVLLDDIDAIGLEQQSKLLRLIETQEFEPVDSGLTHVCHARLILSTCHSLLPLVEQGEFRPDLYFRLNMRKFVIPALRHRKVDLAPLTRKFIRQSSLRHRVQIAEIDRDVDASLRNYPWPGNIRELEQVIQQAVINCRGPRLMKSHFPQHLFPFETAATQNAIPNSSDEGSAHPDNTSEKEAQKHRSPNTIHEKEIIEQTLFQNHFRRTTTAKQLGISRMTLYNKMKKYGLQN